MRVPSNLLSDADRATLLKERLWEKDSFPAAKLSLWRILTEDDPKPGSLTFLIPESPGTRAISQIGRFSHVDKKWIEKLRAAAKRNCDSLKTPEVWQAFAGFVRMDRSVNY